MPSHAGTHSSTPEAFSRDAGALVPPIAGQWESLRLVYGHLPFELGPSLYFGSESDCRIAVWRSTSATC